MGFTMRVTRFLGATLLFLVLPTCAYANNDDFECLKHLSGSSSMDTNCYDGVADAIQIENNQIFSNIKKTMPRGNRNVGLLTEYMKAEDKNLRFCKIDKEAGSGWKPSITSPTVYNMWDVVYAECVYNRRKEQNAHLKRIRDLEKTDHPSQ